MRKTLGNQYRVYHINQTCEEKNIKIKQNNLSKNWYGDQMSIMSTCVYRFTQISEGQLSEGWSESRYKTNKTDKK